MDQGRCDPAAIPPGPRAAAVAVAEAGRRIESRLSRVACRGELLELIKALVAERRLTALAVTHSDRQANALARRIVAIEATKESAISARSWRGCAIVAGFAAQLLRVRCWLRYCLNGVWVQISRTDSEMFVCDDAELTGTRYAIAYCVGACGLMAVTVGVAGLVGPMPASPALGLAIAGVGALVPVAPMIARWRRRSAESPGRLSNRFVTSVGLAAAVIMGLVLAIYGRSMALAPIPVLAAALELALMPTFLRLLGQRGSRGEPSTSSSAPLASRFSSRLALVLAAIFMVQMVRLSAFMTAPDFRWGAALPTYGVDHSCLPAYARAAELAADKPRSIYALEEYTRRPADACDSTAISQMASYASDPYQYPPTFLPIMGAALALTQDFTRLRPLWYMLGLLATLALFAWVAHRLQRPEAWLLSALAMASLPTIYTLQYGQVHLLAIAAALAAMLAFSAPAGDGHVRRPMYALGGALLAAATVTKLFPGILAVVLVARGQWRAVAWTAIMAVVFAVLTLVAYGPVPFEVFFTDQLPRLLDGRAFEAFADTEEFLASNFAVGSLIYKIDAVVALPAVESIARVVSAIYIIGLSIGAVVVARRRTQPAVDVVRLLALLCLASLVGAYSPGSYSAAPFLWLGALLLALRPPRNLQQWAVVLALWAFFQLSPVFSSLPVLWRLTPLHAPGALLAQVAVLLLATIALVYRRSSSESAQKEGHS